MKITGNQLIAGAWKASTSSSGFTAFDPSNSDALEPKFYDATEAEVDEAMSRAKDAFDELRNKSADQRAQFLDCMADEVMALGDGLLERAQRETGLPLPRLTMERGRAVNQCKMFANILREGSWVDARIDLPNPDRQPVPKPDVRRMLKPIGPVVVFGASNFPLAISVFGSDTVSAIGAGCPVVVKAHPAHPGTCELLAEAIRRAVEKSGMPEGSFSLLQGVSNSVGAALVNHPASEAVAFTGSLRGGRALMDLAAKRERPIPVYAEMGSTNPVFVLPGAMAERGKAIAEGLIQSVNMGVGQFCTSPGIALGIQSDALAQFSSQLSELVKSCPNASMLHKGIATAYANGLDRIKSTNEVKVVGHSEQAPDSIKTEASCHVFEATIETYLKEAQLAEENFGPSTILLSGENEGSLKDFAESLDAQLTVTLHANENDLINFQDLITILERKAGRLIINGFPTGLEVCASMQHGGPYPAASHSFFTSVGTASIDRFVRPISYEGFPDSSLPIELRNENTKNIWRLVDNVRTKDSVEFK